jgi:hypothetical protein
LLPAATGFGLPLFVTVRSQAVVTVVVTVVLLLAEFGSLVAADTDEFAVIVPAATDGATFTTTTMSTDAPTAMLGFVQFTFPVPPTAGVVHVHPAGADTPWNVVLTGVASVKLTLVAAAGPLFVIVCVYVMSLPANTSGVVAVLSARSACAAVATTSVAVAEFAPNAWFAAFTVTVSLITVPLAVPAFTVYTTVNVPLEPAATLAFVQIVGNPAQFHPAGGVIDTNVVFAGVLSVKVAVVAADDPVLVTTCV